MSATKLSTGRQGPASFVMAENLALVRGGREVFRNVNFSLSAGTALVLTGANGAGKTSLLRVLAGVLAPAAGRIETLPAAFLPAQDAAWPAMQTVERALSFWARLFGADMMPAVAALGLTGLLPRRCGLLSAGQKRRLSLARVMLQPASLWLLDEPLNSLDAAGRDMFSRVLSGHLAGGGCAVIASHEALPALSGGDYALCRMGGDA